MRTEFFAIICESDNDLLWSNEFGWVDTPTFDLFTRGEMGSLMLPVEGRWVQMAWADPIAEQSQGS